MKSTHVSTCVGALRIVLVSSMPSSSFTKQMGRPTVSEITLKLSFLARKNEVAGVFFQCSETTDKRCAFVKQQFRLLSKRNNIAMILITRLWIFIENSIKKLQSFYVPFVSIFLTKCFTILLCVFFCFLFFWITQYD